MPATNELLQEGRYRISQTSTLNGDERVFEAYDTVRNTNVIVREIPVKMNKVMTVSQQESLKLAFANQAKALTEIEHDSLLHVHDYFSEIDRQYLVMEAVEGDDLRELLTKNRQAFPVSQVTAWADQLLDALNYLHTCKPAIIHRNVNPGNLKVDANGKVKLQGVAVGGNSEPDLSDQAESENLRYSPMEQIWPGLDPASQKAITNSYDDRSERILKEPLDARSDIYSLGATLYFLITGEEPVDPLERSIEILEGKLDPLREPTKVDPRIPSEISDVLMKSLEIKRENRYDSAMIMRSVLQSAISRVEEREVEDSREQREAAEIIRQAAQAKPDPAVEERRRQAEEAEKREAEQAEQKRITAAAAEQKRLEAEAAEKQRQADAEQKRLAAEAEQKRLAAEAEQKRQEAEAEQKRVAAEAEQKQKEAMERQLRQAEEERRAAEAAEAERLLREEHETAHKAEASTAPTDENLLDIPAGAEVVAYRDTADVDEDELAAVLRELEEVESGGASDGASVAEVADDRHVDSETDEDDEIFSVPERTGFSLPMPAIAGIVGLVLVIAFGGWFAFSGPAEAPKPEAVQVAQPAPAETAPSSDPIVSSQSESDANTSLTEPQAQQQAAAAKPAATPKPKKETAKAEDKKKVTVDDLINDN